MKPLELVEEDTPLEISENIRYVNEMRGQRDVLLRVARAGKYYMEIREKHGYPHFTSAPTEYEDKRDAKRSFMKALKEAEKLGIL